MNKNLIYMISTEDNEYSISTWKNWCNKNNIDFIISDNYQNIFDKKYDKFGLINSDTMIKWDAPNIFELFNENEFCGVVDDTNLKEIYEGINNYKKSFTDVNIDISNYINNDVTFFGKKYLYIFKDFDNLSSKKLSINHRLQNNDVTLKKLSPDWNLIEMHKRHFFSHNWQLKEDNTPFFIKYGKIWNFGGLNISDKINFMGQTWNIIADKYK